MPYRDFPLVHAPLTFLVQAGIMRLAGRHYGLIVIYAAIAGGLGTVLSWRILLRLLRSVDASGRWNWSIALLFAAPLIVLGIYPSIRTPSMTAIAVALSAAVMRPLAILSADDTAPDEGCNRTQRRLNILLLNPQELRSIAVTTLHDQFIERLSVLLRMDRVRKRGVEEGDAREAPESFRPVALSKVTSTNSWPIHRLINVLIGYPGGRAASHCELHRQNRNLRIQHLALQQQVLQVILLIRGVERGPKQTLETMLLQGCSLERITPGCSQE